MSKVPMCAVMHFEMPYKDRDRAATFWTSEKLGPEMGDYLLVTTALPGERANMPPQAAPGAINGGLFPFKADWPMQYPSVVIDVDDLEAAMARVAVAGGEMLGEPMEIPGIGRYVSFVDTEGNRNSMMAPL